MVAFVMAQKEKKTAATLYFEKAILLVAQSKNKKSK